MAMLGEKYPEAQFAITGVLGPGSNAHGPNEFLHLPTGRKLTAALALLLGITRPASKAFGQRMNGTGLGRGNVCECEAAATA